MKRVGLHMGPFDPHVKPYDNPRGNRLTGVSYLCKDSGVGPWVGFRLKTGLNGVWWVAYLFA